MFVKDLARLCLVDPLVATIFFFRGCTQPCGFGYRRRICMARHLRRWPFPVSNVCGLLPQHSADATPEPIRMLSTPPKGCRRVHRPVFVFAFAFHVVASLSAVGKRPHLHQIIRSAYLNSRLTTEPHSHAIILFWCLGIFLDLNFNSQPMRICSIERISDTWR